MGLNVIVDTSKGNSEEPSEISDLEQEIDSEDTTTEQVTQTPQEDPEEGIPERFKGKSRKDIAKSYSELEKLLGRQSTELGNLRKLAEDYVNKTSSVPEDENVNYEELIEDPNKAIDKRLSSKVKQFEEKLSQIEQNNARKEILRIHSDANEVVSDPEFRQWVVSDPLRIEQFRQANEGFNVDSANDLLTEWKARKEAAKATLKAQRAEELKAAATETSSTGQSSSKKVYRRSDLIRLRQEDPEKFNALQPEILRAYSEGRVR